MEVAQHQTGAHLFAMLVVASRTVVEKLHCVSWNYAAMRVGLLRHLRCAGDADEGGNADAAQGPAGLSLDEQLGLNIGLLQPQLWPTPILSQLPVLNIDKDDDEPATVCQVKEKCIVYFGNRFCPESRTGLWRSRAVTG